MQEGARNSLLKLLEEPPATINIVLTAKRREAIMPTLLSRLRPYRFLKRGAEKESEVIRRVFRDTADSADSGGLARYLDSFLPQPDDKLRALAAFFVTSLARAAVLKLKQDGAAWIPAELTALGAYCAPFAEAAGFPKSHSSGEVCALILAESADFEGRSFSRFLRFCLDFVSAALQKNGAYPHSIAYNDIWRKNTAQADMAAGVWNQNPALALEAFFYGLRSSMIDTGLRAEAS